MSLSNFQTLAPWTLHTERPSVTTIDGSLLAEAGPDTLVVSKAALDTGRRAVLLTAGNVLTDTRELPSQMPAGIQPSLDGQRVFVSDGTGDFASLPAVPTTPTNFEHDRPA